MSIGDIAGQVFPFLQGVQRAVVDLTLGEIHRRLIDSWIVGITDRRAESEITPVQGEFPLEVFDRQNVGNDRRLS